MQEIRFLVQGSAAEPYETTFIRDGDKLSAFCTCPAGIHGQYCKHRFGILGGDGKAVVSENAGDVEKVVGWLIGTELEEAMKDYESAEADFKDAKNRLAIIKKIVARTMMS